MRINRVFLAGLIILVALAGSSPLAIASRGSTARPAVAPLPYIVFTFDGKTVGKPITAPKTADDFEIFWSTQGCDANTEFPPIIVEFTYHGELIAGDPPLAPCYANDVGIHWQPMKTATGLVNKIIVANWTEGNKVLAPIALPKGNLVNSPATGVAKNPFVDDVCFELSYIDGGIQSATWTRNGVALGKPITLPTTNQVKPNDVCWYGYRKAATAT